MLALKGWLHRATQPDLGGLKAGVEVIQMRKGKSALLNGRTIFGKPENRLIASVVPLTS
jgi:hypothetical protein